MISSEAKIKSLKHYLKEEFDLIWEQYLTRFESGTKPLELWITDAYPECLRAHTTKWEDGIDEYSIINTTRKIRKLSREYKIEVSFTNKVNKEDILSIPYLEYCMGTVNYLLRQDVINIMQQICPDDFESLPVILTGHDKTGKPFEIKDFYSINLLKCVDAIDQEKSIIEWNYTTAHMRKLRYKENPWQDGCLEKLETKNNRPQYTYFTLEKPCKIALDGLTGAVIWHPELAAALPKDSYHWFIQDVEQLTWISDDYLEKVIIEQSPYPLLTKAKLYGRKILGLKNF